MWRIKRFWSGQPVRLRRSWTDKLKPGEHLELGSGHSRLQIGLNRARKPMKELDKDEPS